MNIELREEDKIRLMNCRMVYEIMRKIFLREDKIDHMFEHLYVVCLANNNKLLNIELVSMGSMKQSTIEPIQVFRLAIQKGAVKVVLVHNHPDGELIPSRADEETTDHLIQVGKIIDIEVVEHLIISDRGYYSFEAHGVIKKLEKYSEWKPNYIQVQEIKKEALKIGEEIGLKKGRREGKKEGIKEGKEKGIVEGKKQGLKEGEKRNSQKIARKMKKQGFEEKEIAKLTGLTLQEIKEL